MTAPDAVPVRAAIQVTSEAPRTDDYVGNLLLRRRRRRPVTRWRWTCLTCRNRPGGIALGSSIAWESAVEHREAVHDGYGSILGAPTVGAS